jgi:HAD superfamily hydrolase (TIGR01458 family)
MNSLNSVQGFLFDIDGVLYIDGTPISGAIDAINTVKGTGYPCRFVTNTSVNSRRHIHDKLKDMGFAVTEEEIFSATQATVRYLQQGTGVRCKLYVADAVRPDFENIRQTTGTPTHVVIGDIGPVWNYDLLNTILDDLLAGAELIAIHKNRFWQTQEGLRMDIGGFIAALEYACNRPARVMGKPSRDFFDLAANDLGVPKSAIAVVGDDIDSDVKGAQDAGLSGVLCKTGKFREEYFQASAVKPDFIIDSIKFLPYLLHRKTN